MNELTNALRVADAAFKTVKVMEYAKKAVVAGSVIVCCCFAFRFVRSKINE